MEVDGACGDDGEPCNSSAELDDCGVVDVIVARPDRREVES